MTEKTRSGSWWVGLSREEMSEEIRKRSADFEKSEFGQLQGSGIYAPNVPRGRSGRSPGRNGRSARD